MKKSEDQTDSLIIPGRMPCSEIGFVNSLLDDLDGMVVVRTVDAAEGRMEFWVAPDLIDEFRTFVDYCNQGLGIPTSLDDPIPASTEIASQLPRRKPPSE